MPTRRAPAPPGRIERPVAGGRVGEGGRWFLVSPPHKLVISEGQTGPAFVPRVRLWLCLRQCECEGGWPPET